MNWFLMLLSAVAGGAATWFYSVRTVRRQVPVYGKSSAPAAPVAADEAVAGDSAKVAPAEAAAPVAVAGFAATAPGSREDADTASPAGSDVPVPAEPAIAAESGVPEQGVLSGLEATAPARGSDAEASAPRKKPRTKKKPAAPAAEVEVAGAVPVALVGDSDNPHGWTIKGNADSGLYHSPKSPSYKRTKAEAWFETEADAEAAGFLRWDHNKKKAAEPAALVTVPDGPYGPGSAAPAEDGSGPEGWTVKGNANSGLYHAIASPWYKRTKAEAWFETEAAAEAAGFARWDSRTKK